MSESEPIKSEIVRIDKSVAVCCDRIDRHDKQIEALYDEVHETKRSVNEIKYSMGSEFVSLKIRYKNLEDKLGKLSELIEKNTAANIAVSTAYRAIAVMMGIIATAGGLLLGVIKLVSGNG